jgi:hypothetical protein
MIQQIGRDWIPASEDPPSDEEIQRLMVCLLFPLAGGLQFHVAIVFPCSESVELLRVDLGRD